MRTFVALVLLTTCLLPCTQAVELFPTNSVWFMRKGTNEASSPVTAWRQIAFNQTNAAFLPSPAPFWFGDAYPGGTQLIGMQNSYSCIFLRRAFVIADTNEVASLRLRAFVDDGFVAWINGVEVARTNVTAASPTYQTLASSSTERPPFELYNLPPPAGYLTNGTNVIAIQVFNSSLGSTDLGFDAFLEATLTQTDFDPPTIVVASPAPGNVNTLTSITVTFSEPVTGLTADDFLINDLPISEVTTNASNNIYTFDFPQLPYGLVQIKWATDHAITDMASPPNPFDAESPAATWHYTLVDNLPPTVTNLHPVPGLSLGTLSQIQVAFSEAVQGVQATDLLINGQPATNLTVNAGVHLFQFPSPTTGTVQVAWAPGHGITDAATPPNPFAGGAWNYVLAPGALLPDLVINEFLASNVSTNGLADEDGEQQDWIELHNRGNTTVNLEGWALSDDSGLPGLWTFPARTLAPNAYLIIFASGKDRRSTNSASPLHTNFRLSGDGEHLALYTPDSPRALAHGFDPYPEQRNDNSYGYDTNNNLRYFSTPTPGAPNGGSSIVGVCAPVVANVNRGHFANPFDLMLSCETPNVTFRYTTNGVEPTASSPVFPSSLRINSTTLFRAAAFRTNYLPSKTTTHSYLFNLPAAIRSLPVMSIVTASNHLWGPAGINSNPTQHGMAWERPTSAEWIKPGDNSGFQVDCGIRIQGSDNSRNQLNANSKFSYRLYFRNDYGPGRLNYPLFPDTTLESFDGIVLRGGQNEQGNPFIRDELHRRLASDMGQIAAHGNMAVLLVNGKYYNSSPFYNPCERITADFFQSHLGGGEAWDVVKPPSQEGGVVEGSFADMQALVNYVTNTANVTNQSGYTTISQWMDLTNFVDYLVLNTYCMMRDWPFNNWRAGRELAPGGLWRFVVWDAEFGMGLYGRAANYANSFTDTTIGMGNPTAEISKLYRGLRNSPEFRLLWADRVQKHFYNEGALTLANITNRFRQLESELSEIIPSMDQFILGWVRDRWPIYLGHMNGQGLQSTVVTPTFNQHGGPAPAGFNLTITAPAGTNYYTTDGSDPRVAFTGAVSPSAEKYTGAIPLNNTITIRARALNGGVWSALNEATFTVGSLGVPVRITEIMYNPPGGSLHEFIELENTSPTAVNLSGMYFDGINFIFNQGVIIPGGARWVLGVNTDTNAWKAQYPGVNPVGWFSGNLNNAGERISLYDSSGNLVTFVEYSDSGGWPTGADGGGRSLEILDINGNPNDPANWQASAVNKGTPGTTNSTPPSQTVHLNELMAENASAVNHNGTFPDWVELRNPGGSPVNIGGWSLTDSGNARKFVFPSATIPAFGFLVVWCDAATNTTPGLHTDFSFAREGEQVLLYDANTNRIDGVSFGPQLEDYSLGRISGEWTLTQPTPNATNVAASLASVTNLVINEWLADPVPGQDDWVELYNRSAVLPISLHGIYMGTSNRLHQLLWHSYLPPLGHLQLLANETVGADRLSFNLPGTGQAIMLFDATGGEVQTVIYGQQTQGVSQGRLPSGATNVVNFPGSISPGASNYVMSYTGPVINEVLARNQSVNVEGQFVDFVELRNSGGGSFNLAGMSLSVDSPEPGKWVFPTNTLLPAGGHLLIKCDSASPVSTNAGSFNLGDSLDGESGGVYLFSTNGQMVNFVEYGFQVQDLSIGLSSGQWRLLSIPTPGIANASPAVLGTNTALRINEWMPSPLSGDDWFEIFNTTNRPVDLSTISLSDDPSLVGQEKFRPSPLSFVGANGFVTWQAGANAGQGQNHVNFALSGSGESLLIYGVNGTTFAPVDAVAFGAQTTGLSSGRLLDGGNNIVAFPGSPTPGQSNYRLLQTVVINEVLSHTDPPLEDAIELHNPTASPVSVAGWFLSNSRNQLRKYQITNATPIAPGGYAVFYQNQFDAGTTNAFALNSAYGDELWLTATSGGIETGDRATVVFGASLNGTSFGRIETTQGVDFWPLTDRTYGVDAPATLAQFRTGTGLPNAAPVVGPVVINEVHYHPPGGTNGSEEFIELLNNTASAVALYDPAYPTNSWKLGGGVSFTFPSGVTFNSGQSLLVVDFDPQANPTALAGFRARYGIDPSVPVYGPFAGNLANDEDTVELLRPDNPQLPPNPDAGFVPYVIADRVSYTDGPPWPSGAVDGGGFSLQRIAATLYGNEPLNWTQAAPTPGAESSPAPSDSDGDGIPDLVEDQMGLNRTNALDGALDFDLDGMSNLQEYLAGTGHLDPDSCLKFDQITPGVTVSLGFQAVSNRTYSVFYKNSLADVDWLKLADVEASGVTTNRVVIDASESGLERFYLLVTPAQP